MQKIFIYNLGLLFLIDSKMDYGNNYYQHVCQACVAYLVTILNLIAGTAKEIQNIIANKIMQVDNKQESLVHVSDKYIHQLTKLNFQRV